MDGFNKTKIEVETMIESKNKPIYTSTELGIEASHRLQNLNDTILLNNSKLNNCGKMSAKDQIKEFPLVQSRVLNYINSLIGKKEIISTLQISTTLNIPENIIIKILKDNRFELDEPNDTEDD